MKPAPASQNASRHSQKDFLDENAALRLTIPSVTSCDIQTSSRQNRNPVLMEKKKKEKKNAQDERMAF